MQINSIISNHFGVNSWIVSDDITKETAVIDPGGEASQIMGLISDSGLNLKYILMTHTHPDHIAGAAELQRLNKLPVMFFETAIAQLNLAVELGQMIGFSDLELPTNVDYLSESSDLSLGAVAIKIIALPGHSPCGCGFLIENSLFAGDTLFQHGVGRVDLPGGSWEILSQSLDKLLELPAQTAVYPGHGPSTTIGEEKLNNPFINQE